MSACRDCECASTVGQTPGATPSWSVRRSFIDVAGWLVPGIVLSLPPKCPACLAAYVAIGTGLALSATTATYLRLTLLVLSLALLTYMGQRGFRGLLAGRTTTGT